MKISIEKAPKPLDRYVWCDNPDCRKLPQYFFIPENETMANGPMIWGGRRLLKEGTLMGVIDISLGGTIRKFYICRDCIDLVYKEVKMTLDSSLWAFH